jgi:hypothetical protein
MADDERLETSGELTISEVAAACGVDRRAIERRLRQGDFPNAWRAVSENGTSSFQPVWRIPLCDLRAVGLAPDATRLQPRTPVASTNGAEIAQLRGELAEWQRRALIAEALADERLQALADARQALRALATAIERPRDEDRPVELQADEPEDPAPEPVRARGNWLL